MSVKCPYCKGPARLTPGAEVFPHVPELYREWYYVCRACDAQVGCHKGSKRPLGLPANQALRTKRAHAHRIFDKVWKKHKLMSRRETYKKLARFMNISIQYCHIGMFSHDQCNKTIAFAKNLYERQKNQEKS